MLDHVEYFTDRTLRRTLTRMLGYAPTSVEVRQRTEIVSCAATGGPCEEFRLDGKPLFRHRLVREGLGLLSDVTLLV